MPQPVPPEQPSIVQSLSEVSSDQKALSVAASVTTNPLVSPNTLTNSTKSADLLGPALKVGYPVKPIAANTASISKNLNPTFPVNPSSSGNQPYPSPKSPSSLQAPNPPKISLSSGKTTRSLNQAFSASTPPPPSTSLVFPSEEPPNPQAAFNFRFKVIAPQSATLSVLAQQQRPPVVQPTPPPPGIFAPQPSQPTPAVVKERIIELTSERQEYDTQRQIVTAEGKVELRIQGAVLTANRLQVNLQNLIGVGEGNVVITRGQQVLRGERLTYNFVQSSGEIFKARGDVYLPATKTDFSGNLPTDLTLGGVAQQPPDQRQLLDQPLGQVTSSGGIGIRAGPGRFVNPAQDVQQSGSIRRLRFQAERINFYPGGWQATNVRITNDPFSPPELEYRADTATLTQQTPTQSQIVSTRPRLVFDQGFTLPIPKKEATIGRRQRNVNTFPVQIGYDVRDKGGIYIQRGFTAISTEQLSLSLAPEFFVQGAAKGNSDIASLFGLSARLDSNLGPRTQIRGLADVNGFNSNDIQNKLRASLRLRQLIGDINQPYTLSLESSYRDRLFNGSLGYNTVQSSIGAVLTSPSISLGNGINLSYQVGLQDVLADTDRLELLSPTRTNNRIPLGRIQGTAALSRAFVLSQGKALPTTASQGLKYTPTPVIPYLVAVTSLQGVSTYYTSGDSQNSLTAAVGLVGQLGHFSRRYLDYTNFNLTFSQGIVAGSSPFLFDRFVDNKVLVAGITQQIYGPFRLGVQTILNLDTGKQISTDYILEYSRRTYGVSLRFNPVLGLGSISFRVSDFNFVGGTSAFSSSDVQPVVNGVRRETP